MEHDEHLISFGSIFLTIVALGIFSVGGTLLFLTFRHWKKEALAKSNGSKGTDSVLSHFDQSAQKWDTPEKQEMAQKFSKKIIQEISDFQIQSILEIGCGTGLLGLQFLQNQVQYLGIDQSEKMLEVLKAKFPNNSNVKTTLVDIENQPIPNINFNFVVSSMAFHHLKKPVDVLRKIRNQVQEKTMIAIIDLDKEDGSFHPDPANMGVQHFGFSKDEVLTWGQELNLKLIHYSLIHKIHKNDKKYPQFLVIFEVNA